MIGEKKIKEDPEESHSTDNEWGNISNFVAAFAQNNETLENEPVIVKTIIKEEEKLPAYQPQYKPTGRPKYGIGVSIQKEFHFMDREFKEVADNFQNLKSELNEMLGELNEIRQARIDLQNRLEKIDAG